MNSSIILKLCCKAYSTLKTWFENSLYYKIWISIMNWFGKLYKNSFIYNYFTKVNNSASNSFFASTAEKTSLIFNKIINVPLNLFVKLSESSYICKWYKFMLQNWHYISVRYYGIFVLSFAAISGALDRASHGFISNRWIYIALIGGLMCLISPSFSVLVSGEYFVSKFKINPFKNPKTINTKTYTSVTISIIAGSIFAVLNLFPLLLMIFTGILALITAMLFPDVLIFASIVLLPFIPTMMLVGLMLLAFVSKIIKNRDAFKPDGFDFAAFCLIFMNIYGVICSATPMQSLKIAAVYIVFILFFFFARRMLKNIKNFFITIDSFIVSATLVAGYGIIEYIFGLTETTWQDEEMFEEMAGRVCSTFENPNVLGEFFLLTLPLTVIRMFYLKNIKTKLLYSAFAIVQGICLVFTYSRGCWLGIILAAGILLLFSAKKLFVLMTAGVFAVPFVLPQNVIDRFLSIGNTADSSTSYRIYIWEGTLRMLKDTWAYGIGLGTAAFNAVYQRYALGAISAPHPHNLYLLILTETGIIGLILFLFAMFYVFKGLGYVAKNKPNFRNLSIGFMACFGGYFLQGIFDNVWYNYRIYALFIIFIAFVAALKDISEVEKND